MASLVLPQQYCPQTMSNQPCCPQRHRYTKCRNPCPIPPRHRRFPCQIKLANGHQSRQLHFLAGPRLRQCVHVLPFQNQNCPRPHQADATRKQIHQSLNADQTNGTNPACRKTQGTPCPDRANKKSLHRQHGPFPLPILQRQLLHHDCLPHRI